MQKPKRKIRKILVILMLSIVAIINIPTLIGWGTTDNVESTAYAQDDGPVFGEGTEDPTGVSTPDETPAPVVTQPPPAGSTSGASTTTPTPLGGELGEETKRSLSFIVQMQQILNRLIWPVLVMIGGLMDNSLLFGSGMEEHLREIWIPIRNIVNIFFVVALVGIALYNVLGIGEEEGSYSIKAILPKIIVGIIAVNFSFLGIKVFLDTVNVLTVSVFSLPNSINEEMAIVMDPKTEADKNVVMRFCKLLDGRKVNETVSEEQFEADTENAIYRVAAKEIGITAFDSPGTKATIIAAAKKVSPSKEENLKTKVENLKDGQICIGTELSPHGKAFLKSFNSRNAALAMALNMGKIVFYEDIPLEIDKIEKLAINAIFSMLLYLIYVASFLALFVVLLARLVVLWLAIALSPILLLGIAVPLVKEKISGFGDISSKFVQNAIAPLGIAVSMTVGWIMLNAVQGAEKLGGSGVINFGAGNGIPVMGLNTIQDLIVALGTVAVVWLGVFTAASQSIAAPVTDAMKGALTKVGTFLGTMPLKHAAIFPVKIPGRDEPFPATAMQLYQALKESPMVLNKDRALAKEIYKTNLASLDSIDKNSTKEEIRGTLKAKELEIVNMNDYELGKLKKLFKAGTLHNKLSTEELDLIEKIVNNKDKNAAKKLFNEVKSMKNVSARTVPASDAKKTEDKVKTKDAKTEVKDVTTVGGVTVVGADSKKRITGARDNVIAEAKESTQNLTALKTHIGQINFTDSDGKITYVTTTELKKLVGDDTYDKITKKFGGEAKLAEYLAELKKPADDKADDDEAVKKAPPAAAPSTTTPNDEPPAAT